MPQMPKTKTNLFLVIFLAGSVAGFISCNQKCEDVVCAPCPMNSFETTSIYYYDTTIVDKNDAELIYLYQYDSMGVPLYFNSIPNPEIKFRHLPWNYMTLNDLRIGRNGLAQKGKWVVTLKDSTFSVTLENIITHFKSGGEGCCSCGDRILDSLKINNKFYTQSDLPIMIN